MKSYLVHRVETIHYDKEYAEAELIEMGVPAEVFTDLTAFDDAVSVSDALCDALTEDTESRGDVQGSNWTIEEV